MVNAGALLRETRIRNGLDQRTLARRAGTTQAQVSRIERGAVSPGVDTLARLLAAMGLQLRVEAVPGPRANRATADLVRDAHELTAGERIAQAIELSRMLTGMTALGVRR